MGFIADRLDQIISGLESGFFSDIDIIRMKSDFLKAIFMVYSNLDVDVWEAQASELKSIWEYYDINLGWLQKIQLPGRKLLLTTEDVLEILDILGDPMRSRGTKEICRGANNKTTVLGGHILTCDQEFGLFSAVHLYSELSGGFLQDLFNFFSPY